MPCGIWRGPSIEAKAPGRRWLYRRPVAQSHERGARSRLRHKLAMPRSLQSPAVGRGYSLRMAKADHCGNGHWPQLFDVRRLAPVGWETREPALARLKGARACRATSTPPMPIPRNFRISDFSVTPKNLEIYFSGNSHPMTATKLTDRTPNKMTSGKLTDPSCHLLTVDVVMVDVAQRNGVIDRVGPHLWVLLYT